MQLDRHIVIPTEEKYATQDNHGACKILLQAPWGNSDMCHLMPQSHLPQWWEEEEPTFVHCSCWLLDKGLDSTVNYIYMSF